MTPEEALALDDYTRAKIRWVEIRKLDFQLETVRTITLCLLSIMISKVVMP
jgi:hypothetical protein